MYSNANNLKSEIVGSVSANDSTVSITPGEGVLRANDTVACLEHYENEICTKREVIKITSITDNTLTITRSFAVCVMNDKTKEKGDTAFSFDEGDFLSMYLSKELRESLTDGVGENQTAYETMLENLAVPRTCINNCLTTRQSAIDTAYRTKFGGLAGFGNGSDGDCVISEDTFLDAGREYNFRNLTICPDVLVRFEGAGVPTINVRDKFCNLGTIELKAPYVSDSSILECWCSCGKELCNKTTDWGACCGGAGGTNGGCVGEPGTGTSGGKGGGVIDGTEGGEPDGLNGGEGAYPTNHCNGYGGGGGGGGGGRYGNGGTGGRGGYCGVQTSGGKGGNGGNSGLYGTGGTGGRAGSAYSAGSSGYGGNGGNGYYGGYGGDGGSCGYAGDGGCGIIEGGHGGNACGDYALPGCGGDAITNVYGFHLNARCIFNYCVNARGGKGGEGGNGSGSSCNYHFTCGCPGGNGADGGQMIITYCKMIEEGCFDVSGGDGGLGGRTYACLGTGCPRPMRMQSGMGGANGRKVMYCMNNPNITSLMYTLGETKVMREDSKLLPSSGITRGKTVVVCSDEDFPESPEDGTLVVESTVYNQYKDTPYTVELPAGTYYFSFFSYDTDNNLISKYQKLYNIIGDVQYAIVGGGGGGGYGCRSSSCSLGGGGGGAGGVLKGITCMGGDFEVVIGAGGLGGDGTSGCNGGNTCFGTEVAYGGGGGGGANLAGCDGGSGGGGGGYRKAGGVCCEGQGAGGACACNCYGGGGGGRTTYGKCCSSAGGNGGDGITICLNPNCVTSCISFAGGGGGGSISCYCSGGVGCCGGGSGGRTGAGGNATGYGSGGGGGGGGGYNGCCSCCGNNNGGNGSQGVVFISYCCDCGYSIEGGTTYTCCCYKVHQFTSDGKLCIL